MNIRMPLIDNFPQHVKYSPKSQVGLFNVGFYDVSISTNNAEYALRHKEQLIHDLDFALKVQARIENEPKRSDLWLGYDYWVHPQYIIPAKDAPWIRMEDTQNTHLTVVQRDLRNDYKEIGVNHYILLNEHTRLMAQGDGNRTALKAISEYVESGIAKGIKKGVSDSMKTLSEIQNERFHLEQRLKELEKLEAKAAIRESAKAGKNPRSLSGYVYLLQSPSGNYKIGRTSNPDDRLKTFSVKLPFEVEYVCVIQTDDMYALESNLHQRFWDKRVNGEWFTLSPEDVAHIKGLTS